MNINKELAMLIEYNMREQERTEGSLERACYDSDIPRHRKRASAKPYKLEGRLPASAARNQRFNYWKVWTRIRRYKTKEQAVQAMADMKQRAFWNQFEWRIASES
jgi:hypothetical protein